MTKCDSHSHEGQYIYSNQLKNLDTNHLGCLGSIAIWGNSATTAQNPYGSTPTNTCPTKNSNDRCLGFVAFECHADFQIHYE